MFPISYVKGCKNIHQYTPGTGELLLVMCKNMEDQHTKYVFNKRVSNFYFNDKKTKKLNLFPLYMKLIFGSNLIIRKELLTVTPP